MSNERLGGLDILLDRPDLSVVVPIRDRVWALPRTLDSLLRQLDVTLEVIVVDDGSEEDVEGVVHAYDSDRLRYRRQPPEGANVARNHGAEHSTSRYITFLDADDEVLPGWASEFVSEFSQGADVVCCGFERYEGSTFAEVQLPRPLKGPAEGVTGMFSHAGTYALRRELFFNIGGFAPGLRASQHTELSYRLVRRAQRLDMRIETIDRPLMRYHASLGGIRDNDEAVLQGSEYILHEYDELLSQYPSVKANKHRVAGYRLARLGRFPESRNHFLRAVRLEPRSLRTWARLFVSCVPAVASRVWGR